MILQRVSQIIKNILFIGILIVVVSISSIFLRDKDHRRKTENFFSSNTEFDVLLFGSSHMEVFIAPYDLWKKYGITSYNFGYPEQTIPISYWTIENAIQYHKPRIIVLDTHFYNFTNDYLDDKHIQYTMNSFPFSIKKISAVWDLSEKKSFLGNLFPISGQHYRWKELTKEDFVYASKYMMGSLSYGIQKSMNVADIERVSRTDGKYEASEEDIDIVYINKLIDLCKKNDIELIFTKFPSNSGDFVQYNTHTIEEYANKHKIKFLNMTEFDNIIDYNTDLYDDIHVNQSGMHKVTNYLGSYISENYKLTDHRNDSDYADWDTGYDNYKKLKYECIRQMDDLNNVLMLLNDDDIISYIYCRPDYEAKDKAKFEHLTQNISDKSYRIDNLSEYIEDGYKFDIVIVAKDKSSNETIAVKGYNYSGCDYICEEIL